MEAPASAQALADDLGVPLVVMRPGGFARPPEFQGTPVESRHILRAPAPGGPVDLFVTVRNEVDLGGLVRCTEVAMRGGAGSSCGLVAEFDPLADVEAVTVNGTVSDDRTSVVELRVPAAVAGPCGEGPAMAETWHDDERLDETPIGEFPVC